MASNSKLEKTRMGAPEKPFDWNLLESLAILECELLYVAERMLIGVGAEVNKTAIESMMKRINRQLSKRFDCTYVQYRRQKEEYRRAKLRQLMWKTAEKGNCVMQIWLSKQILGYSDKVEQTIDADHGVMFVESYEKEDEGN